MEGPIHVDTFQQVNGIRLSTTFSNKNYCRLITSQPEANFKEQIDDTSFKHNKIQDSRLSSTPIWTQFWRLLVYNCVYLSRYLYKNYILKYCENAWRNNDLKNGVGVDVLTILAIIVFLFATRNTSYLSGLNCISQVSSHCCRLSMSF
jgi:hypothetical protein